MIVQFLAIKKIGMIGSLFSDHSLFLDGSAIMNAVAGSSKERIGVS